MQYITRHVSAHIILEKREFTTGSIWHATKSVHYIIQFLKAKVTKPTGSYQKPMGGLESLQLVIPNRAHLQAIRSNSPLVLSSSIRFSSNSHMWASLHSTLHLMTFVITVTNIPSTHVHVLSGFFF
jgi:hypothetical protein